MIPVTTPTSSPNALGTALAAALTAAVNIQNQNAIALYNTGVATAKATGQPLPQPPSQTLVDAGLVIQLEVAANTIFTSGTGQIDSLPWGSVFLTYTYNPNAGQPSPPIVQQPADFVGTQEVGNIYYALAGDPTPNGQLVTDTRGTFQKVLTPSAVGTYAYYLKQ